MKPKATFTAAWTVLALLTGMSGAASANEIDKIKERGTLVCGTGSNYVPFSYVEDQTSRKYVGYDVDLCDAVAKTLGVKPELKFVTTATRIPELQQGRVDLALASVTITPERKQLISFSYPDMVSGTAVITPTAKPLKDFSDLASKRVAVMEGGSSGPAMTAKVPSSKVIGFPTPATAFMALDQGKVHAMAGDETALRGLMRSEPDKYVMFDQYLVVEKMGIGVRKDEPALLAAVNQTLVEMEKSGAAQASYDRWFGANSPLKRKRNFTFGPHEQD